jgi:hypothetical protein
VTAHLLLSLALALPATDSPEQNFKSAIEEFEFGEHAAAAQKLRSILEPVQLANPEDVIVARQYLGACEHLLDNLDAAKKEFTRLLALDPDHRLDPEVFSPAVVQFFEKVRSELTPAPPPPPKVDPTPPPPPLVQTEVVTGRYPAALGLIPLGIGQFLNYHPVRGSIFAVLEVGLLATCGATFGLYGSKRSAAIRDGHAMETSDGLIFNPGFEDDASEIRRLQTVAYVTLWTGLAVVVAGVIEALISYPGDAVIVEKQPST